MILTNKHMGKMSEISIAEQYSMYLQQVLISEVSHGIAPASYLNQQDYITYDEFKDYYILALVGKHNYVDSLAQKIQQQNLAKNA